MASSRITNLCLPDGAIVAERDESSSNILVTGNEICRQIEFYFRTSDMFFPELQYAKSQDGSEVALSVSMVPTFDPVQP